MLLFFAALVATPLIAFGLTALLVPPVMRLCLRHGWVAVPGGRRQHARPTPDVGGIALYLGFVITLVLSFGAGALHPLLQRSPFELLRLGLLLLGSTLIFLVMWLDDVRELPALPKLLAQLASALIAVGPYLWDHTRYPSADGQLTEARGIILTAFNVPFLVQIDLWGLSPWLAIGATLFWFAGMNNTINFSDGMDGLAGGISLIAALALAFHALRLEQYTVALVPLALAGTCAGFLLFNLPPARIFMGDSGAHFLSYVLGVSAILGGAKLATVLLVLGVPILDVAWLIVSRALGRRSVAHAGRDHLHHRLLDLGLSQRQVLGFYYTLSASFGLLGVAETDRLTKLVALGLLVLIMAAVLLAVGRNTSKEVGAQG